MPGPSVLSALTLRPAGPDLSYETGLNPDETFTLSGVQAGTYDAPLSLSSTTTVTVPNVPTLPITLKLLPVTQELQIKDGSDLIVK